jgi:hypothetical protein
MTAIEVCRQAKENGAQLFRFRKGTEQAPEYDCKPWATGNKRGWVILDSFSASAIVAVHDNLSPDNQTKYNKLPISKMAEIAFKLLKRN